MRGHFISLAVTLALLGAGCATGPRSHLHGAGAAMSCTADIVARLDAAEDTTVSSLPALPVPASDLVPRWTRLVYSLKRAYRTAYRAGIAPRRIGLAGYDVGACRQRCAKLETGDAICLVACDVPGDLVAEAATTILNRSRQLKLARLRGEGGCGVLSAQGLQAPLEALDLSGCPRAIVADVRAAMATPAPNREPPPMSRVEKPGTLSVQAPALPPPVEKPVTMAKAAPVPMPAPEAAEPTPIRADKLVGEARLAWREGRQEEAVEKLARAEQLSPELTGLAAARMELSGQALRQGNLLRRSEDLSGAEKKFAQCLRLVETAGPVKRIKACAWLRARMEALARGPREFDAMATATLLRGELFEVFPALGKEHDTDARRTAFGRSPEAAGWRNRMAMLTADTLAAAWGVKLKPGKRVYDPRKRVLTLVLDTPIDAMEASWNPRRWMLAGCSFRQLDIRLVDREKQDGEIYHLQQLRIRIPKAKASLVKRHLATLEAEVWFQVRKPPATRSRQERSRIRLVARNVELRIVDAKTGTTCHVLHAK